MPEDNDITIEYEPESNGHYVCWQPCLPVIGSGTNGIEALLDLKQTAHFFIDSLIDAKLTDLGESH